MGSAGWALEQRMHMSWSSKIKISAFHGLYWIDSGWKWLTWEKVLITIKFEDYVVETCNISICDVTHAYLFQEKKEWLGSYYEKWSRISYDEGRIKNS